MATRALLPAARLYNAASFPREGARRDAQRRLWSPRSPLPADAQVGPADAQRGRLLMDVLLPHAQAPLPREGECVTLKGGAASPTPLTAREAAVAVVGRRAAALAAAAAKARGEADTGPVEQAASAAAEAAARELLLPAAHDSPPVVMTVESVYHLPRAVAAEMGPAERTGFCDEEGVGLGSDVVALCVVVLTPAAWEVLLELLPLAVVLQLPAMRAAINAVVAAAAAGASPAAPPPPPRPRVTGPARAKVARRAVEGGPGVG